MLKRATYSTYCKQNILRFSVKMFKPQYYRFLRCQFTHTIYVRTNCDDVLTAHTIRQYIEISEKQISEAFYYCNHCIRFSLCVDDLRA